MDPVRVTEAERSDQARHQEAQARFYGGDQDRPFTPIPREKPLFNWLRIGTDGRIWVQVATPSERFEPAVEAARDGPDRPQLGWQEPVVYDILEPDGRWIGRVAVQQGLRLHAMTGDIVWGSQSNELDVPFVTRFRIVWP